MELQRRIVSKSQNMDSISVGYTSPHIKNMEFHLKCGSVWPQLIGKNAATYIILRESRKPALWMHPCEFS